MMAKSIREALGILIGTVLIFGVASAARSEEVKAKEFPASVWPSTIPGETETSLKLRLAMRQPTQMDFEETPLEEVIDFLEDLHRVEIALDGNALDDIGIGSDTPITVRFRGITLRSGLNLMLASISKELTFTISNEVILITTVAAVPLQNRVYDVSDLLSGHEDAKELAKVVTTAIEGVSSRDFKIIPYAQLLIVRGDRRSHDELAELLSAIHAQYQAAQ